MLGRIAKLEGRVDVCESRLDGHDGDFKSIAKDIAMLSDLAVQHEEITARSLARHARIEERIRQLAEQVGKRSKSSRR